MVALGRPASMVRCIMQNSILYSFCIRERFFLFLTKNHTLMHVNLCDESSRMNQEGFVIAA